MKKKLKPNEKVVYFAIKLINKDKILVADIVKETDIRDVHIRTILHTLRDKGLITIIKNKPMMVMK